MFDAQQLGHVNIDSRILGSEHPLVAAHHFIVATRETGYRSVATAIAELIDNAVQAKATSIRVFVLDQATSKEVAGGNRETTIAVLDNGEGMDRTTLWTALQFGGTGRFDDRSSLGRFGMGLPNSSVSQSRRFEVYSWHKSGSVQFSYLDVDEFAQRVLHQIPAPTPRSLPAWAARAAGRTGTLVVWPKCDRLDYRRASTIAQKLRAPLGRMYRHLIWGGVKIFVNDDPVAPVDPLFCHPVSGEGGAKPFGDPLDYEIASPGRRTSTVRVRFSELPVAAWRDLSIEEKRERGIVGGAGVSFIRAGREIDYGWLLMGSKRKENYDDWWRCEVYFQPKLDEHFGVTHSKQGVHPTPYLQSILALDIEAIARTLNARVRSAFEATKSTEISRAAQVATRQDQLLPPVASRRAASSGSRWGLSYMVRANHLRGREFFDVEEIDGKLTVTINVDHPFYERMYTPALGKRDGHERFLLECLLLAAARAEIDAPNRAERLWTKRLRSAWGDALAAFLDKCRA